MFCFGFRVDYMILEEVSVLVGWVGDLRGGKFIKWIKNKWVSIGMNVGLVVEDFSFDYSFVSN